MCSKSMMITASGMIHQNKLVVETQLVQSLRGKHGLEPWPPGSSSTGASGKELSPVHTSFG